MSEREIIIAGAAPNSGNLGVSALCHSIVTELLSVNPSLAVTVLDYGDGYRKSAYRLNDRTVCNLMGVKSSRNFLRQSNAKNIGFLSKTGFLLTKTARTMKNSRAILDVSAGDSFTDLYGRERFFGRMFPKQYAVSSNLPLILLPQTYGPFIKGSSLKMAKEIMPYCKLAYARDKYSFEIMKDLLGEHFNSDKHKLGVDVAFLLEAHESDLNVELEKNSTAGKERFGFNVSGLIFNDPQVAERQYGIKVDYAKAMKTSIEHMLAESDGDVWLIPHVIPKDRYSFESDTYASMKLKDLLDEKIKPRVHIMEGNYDQCEIKGVISKLDWFCGMRMHATIAGLSTCVPTANIAYSDKSLGVFESAGQQDQVFDARHLTTDELIQKLNDSWRRRRETRQELETAIPDVKEKAKKQISDILSSIM